MQGSVRLTRLERYGTGWVLKFTCEDRDDFYDVVDAIKLRVPAAYRRFMPDKKCWWIDGLYLSDLATLFVNFQSMRASGSGGLGL